ncbi:hypothetical protein CSQ96_00890 [Janthinobacterium sp. BJB412]|nr:hypothetical protein CSQ96_00890 [Janthinobacterium sp. BJB412]
MLPQPQAHTCAYFTALLNQHFQLPGDDGVALQLIAAEPRGAALPGREAFSLLFSGPQPALPQQIHTLRSEVAGTLEVFLVPVAGVGAAIHYEAVFS